MLWPCLKAGVMSKHKGKSMDFLILIAFLAAWFVLVVFVLPRFGVST